MESRVIGRFRLDGGSGDLLQVEFIGCLYIVIFFGGFLNSRIRSGFYKIVVARYIARDGVHTT